VLHVRKHERTQMQAYAHVCMLAYTGVHIHTSLYTHIHTHMMHVQEKIIILHEERRKPKSSLMFF
jgi:hypothetical protein